MLCVATLDTSHDFWVVISRSYVLGY